jgi:2-phosphoglycolate phosphatase
MTLKAILFDLDGTLLDTAADFIFVVNHMRSSRNLAPIDETAIRQTVSDGARALVTLGFQLREGDAGFEALRQELLDLYNQHLADHTVMFPGIAELLSHIKSQQMNWGIATNKPRAYAEPLIAAMNFDPPCGVLICPDDVSERKPHPESLFLACSTLNCNIDEAIYLGDHQRDIACGQNAGMQTIACSYGYVPAGENVETWQADYLCADSNELLNLIKQIDK